MADAPTAAEFDWLSLEDDEEIRWSSRAHEYSLYAGFAWGIVLLPLFGLGLLIIVGAYLSHQNTHYVVSSERIYAKRGILSRNVKTVDFDKVQKIDYSQSALGAKFGYGTVEISTAGSSGAEVSFKSVPDPAAVQELIDREIKGRRQGRSGGTDDADPEAVLGEVLQELRAIRGLLEEATGSDAAAGQRSDATPRKSPTDDRRPRDEQD